jgi:hypothetical protein
VSCYRRRGRNTSVYVPLRSKRKSDDKSDSKVASDAHLIFINQKGINMRRITVLSSMRSMALAGCLVVLVAGCTAGQSQLSSDGASSSKPMAGCGMMIDGKMVYKNPASGDCMTMNKPGNSMPPGVTMHSDPARP